MKLFNIFSKLFFLFFIVVLMLPFFQCSTNYNYYRENSGNNKNLEVIEKKSKVENQILVKVLIEKKDLDSSFKIVINKSKTFNSKYPSTDNFLYLTKNNINKIYTNNTGFYYKNEFIGNSLELVKKSNYLYLVSLIPLNQYLAGVLKAEMGISFPQEALKAQAIISRTYVLEKIESNPDFIFSNSTQHQVYSQDSTNYFLRFVDSTNNLVIKYKNKLIKPFFCASNGGITTTPELIWKSNNIFPYYKVKIDNFSKNIPEWELTIGRFFIRSIFEKNGYNIGGNGIYVSNIKIENRFQDKRVNNIIFLFSNGKSLKLNGEKFRLLFDPTKIKSTLFTVSFKDNNYIFKGYGYGHGIGFSQLGAKKMAESGFNYKKIIKFYYEGCYIDKYNY